MNEIMLKIDNVSKKYTLGQLGSTTLRDELQRKRAKRKGLEDPTREIGQKDYSSNEKFYALNGVSFEVNKGERVGIIGHNGAGKSTLLKLISRVTAPTSGTISMNGRVASMLEVGTGFHPELTGRENIYMNGAILGMTKKEIDAKIEDIIEFSECRQFIDTPVKRYSSGMYVKLAFSVAAHLDSEILIMDEVLAVGDVTFQKKCIDKMNSMSKDYGRTILYVSHNMSTIRELCDKVIVLNHGKLIFDGKVEAGIEKYISSNKSLEWNKEVSFDNTSNRPNSFPRELFIKKISFVGVDSNLYIKGDTIKLKIELVSKEKYNNVSFRFQFHLDSGELIGTSFLNKSFHIENETKKIYIEIPTNNFVPRKYLIDVIAFRHDGFGSMKAADIINNAICFETTYSNNDIYIWYDNPFGYINFENAKLVEIK